MWDGQMPRGNWMEGQCPTPGMESAGKCPTIARGGGWALLELTDALHLKLTAQT